MARLTFQPLILGLIVILLMLESADLVNCRQLPPNCSTNFYEDGQPERVHNITTLDSNTFVVQFNASKPQRLWETNDGAHLTKIFGGDDQLPPHMRIDCSSPYPTDFEFEGVGALDFFRIYKTGGETRKPCTESGTAGANSTCLNYYMTVHVLLTPQATGKYIIYSVPDKNISWSNFVFAEAKSKPYLLGASSSRSHALKPKLIPGANNTVTVILPCVTSNYNVTVNLYRKFEPQLRSLKDTWLRIHPRTIRYDPKRGFIGTLKSQARGSDFMKLSPGIYKCSTGTDADPDSVILELTSDSAAEKPHIKPSGLSIHFVNKTAICETSNNTSNSSDVLEMSNIFAQNPTESRLLAECVMKGNSYCGTGSIHRRKLADVSLPGIQSDCVQPFCAQIQGVHEFGLVTCSRGSNHEAVQYFTGLDGVIYTDWKLAPLEAVLRPKLRKYVHAYYLNGTLVPNMFVTGVLELRTGIPYYVHCEADWLLFVKWPLTISIKYANGSVIQLAELNWADSVRKLYLSSDMVGIMCTDNLWETNVEVNSTLHIRVEDADCEPNQFKCTANQQCISEDKACNQRSDCPDGSDENSTTCKKFIPQIVPGPSQVIFISQTRNNLICELVHEFPAHLRPRLEWHYKGKNITDNDRLWRDVAGRKLLLQFANVSIADEGEYTCNASNSPGSAEYIVVVRVRLPTIEPSPVSMRTTIKPEYRNEVQKLSTNTNSGIPSEVHEPPHFSSEPNYDQQEGSTGSAFIAGVTTIVLVILVVTIAGVIFGWKTGCRGLRLRWPRFLTGVSPRIRLRGGEIETEEIGSGNTYHAF